MAAYENEWAVTFKGDEGTVITVTCIKERETSFAEIEDWAWNELEHMDMTRIPADSREWFRIVKIERRGEA